MLALQINNQWAVLSEGQSVTIEENSPVWGEGNTFSLPFELDVEANRHILGNSDQLTGMSVYDVLEGQSATLYVMGIPLFYGKLSLEDEVEIENGTVEVSLISSRLTFDDMIEGMNCQDVELTEEIVLGESLKDYDVNIKWHGEHVATAQGFLPNSFMRMRNNGVSTVNTTNPYPSAKYCNVRICYPLPEPLQDEEKGPEKEIEKVQINVNNLYMREGYQSFINRRISGKYVVLDADRALSAPCFYVLYFLQCLFYKLSIDVDFSRLYGEDDKFENDICRLAFFNTSCKFRESDKDETNREYLNLSKNKYEGKFLVVDNWDHPISYWKECSKDSGISATVYFYKRKCIATSENFPKADCSEVIKSLESAFGIRFLFDRKYTRVTPVYVRDVLTDKEIKTVNAEIISVHKAENNTHGFILKYSGEKDDTSFNYNEWENISMISPEEGGKNGYNKLQKNVSMFDKTCYIDSRNGNAYRIKNDDVATDLETQNPALFEVGMFNPVMYGDCSDEKRVHEVTIGFTPIVMNDTEFKERVDALKVDSDPSDTKNNAQEFAAFLDVEMKYPSVAKEQMISGGGRFAFDVKFTYVDIQRYDEKISKYTIGQGTWSEIKDMRYGIYAGGVPLKYLDNESPIQTLDAGLTLGIMRGPGNTSGVQDYDDDYDGEGGSKYVSVPTNYAFHSDTVDNYARVFDYNGTGDDGVDTSKRFSLKLRAEKPTAEGAKKDVPVWPGDFHQITQSYAAGRGLFDKFYTEYAHFVTHRKIAKLTLRMEIADLVNIDWTKRYRIGSFIGFINSYSYTVDSQGISEVQMEMYYI